MARAKIILILITGFTVGVLFSLLCLGVLVIFVAKDCGSKSEPIVVETLMELDPIEIGTREEYDDNEEIDLKNDDPALFNDRHLHADNASVANRIFHDVRVLCLVFINETSIQDGPAQINATWGSRCNKLLFVSNKNDSNMETLSVDVIDGNENVAKKTRRIFDKIYSNYLNDYEWFLKTDVQTFVIMENLRYFLLGQDHEKPLYLGHMLNSSADSSRQSYTRDGAAFVVSRGAVRLFGQKNNELCRFNYESDDDDFGNCMEALQIYLGGSEDLLNRTRFHCFDQHSEVYRNYTSWHVAYEKNEGDIKGFETMSDYAITFSKIVPREMEIMEYLVYHLSPHGIIRGFQDLNRL